MVNTSKKIWLINHYAMPPEFESRLRTIKTANYLIESGYDVTIFSSSFLHNMDKNLIEDNSSYIEKNYGKLRFVHINTMHYKKNGMARILSMLQFHFKLYFLRNKFEKPDVIIHVAAIPFGNIIYFAARKLKAKYIVEILDLWPESFVDLGLISKSNPLVVLSYQAEKWLYQKADRIVFSMEGGKDYIKDKKWDKESGGKIDLNKVYYINNGVDLSDFEKYKEVYKLEDPDLENENLKKVIYIGSIRLANNLKELVDAAALLKDKPNIKFLLYGDGSDRKLLEEFCQKNNVNNIVFKQKWIDPKYVPYLLSKSSLNILNYKSGSFGKYGGSQSKLFQYLASNQPVCSNIKMMYCLINKYNLGIAQEFTSDKEYAQAILSLLDIDQKSLLEMQQRMKNVVAEFDYKVLTNKLVEIF